MCQRMSCDIIWSTNKLLVSLVCEYACFFFPSFSSIYLATLKEILVYWLKDEFLANGTFARNINSSFAQILWRAYVRAIMRKLLCWQVLSNSKESRGKFKLRPQIFRNTIESMIFPQRRGTLKKIAHCCFL